MTLRAALDRLRLGEFHELLAAHDVDERALHELSEADLCELGLTLGQRKRFLRARSEAKAGLRKTRSSGAGERRQLTSMFCDLVGSTPLALRLDPEDFSELICSFQDSCAGIITRGSGYVSAYRGDGVLACFGYPRAREDNAQCAARAALEIVAKIGQLHTPDGEALNVRVGIATGMVVVGDLDEDANGREQTIVGYTLHLASRLQGIASPGEIIISEATRNLSGGQFDYEPRGDIILKGFQEAVTIYRLVGESAAQSRFDARANSGLHPFVGRETELGALVERWCVAQSGAGQIVMVRGEAGIGKSRLVLAFIEQLRNKSVQIVRWNCAAHLANRALHPIVKDIEIRSGFSRTLSTEARRAGVGALVADCPTLGAADESLFADLLGFENDSHDRFDPATRARRMYDALGRWLEGMAQSASVVILLEDAHWADAATLDFLTTIVDRMTRLPMLLLVTHRPNFVPPCVVGEPAKTINLEPLNATAGACLLAAVLRERALPASIVHMILKKAGGVPLFVEELAKTVLDTVPSLNNASESFPTLAIPATLRDSLMARLDQLGDAREIAQIGSVIGREFSDAMLCAIAPDHTDIERGLHRLFDSGLAREDTQNGVRAIKFHHALVQDAAYKSLLRKRRRELHRAVAEAMLANEPAFAGVEPEVIAHHCSRGGLPEPATSHWLAAGRHALDRAANIPAVAYLRAALEQLALLPDNAERAKMELQLHMALAPAISAIYGWAAQDVEIACRRAIDLAKKICDGEALCGATWGLWTNYFIRGELDPALETARSVATMAEETKSTVLELVAAHALTYSHYSRGEYREALSAAEIGIARYEPDADRQALLTFQLSPSLALPTLLSNVHWLLGSDAEADASMAKAHAMAEELKHPPALVHCLCVSSYFLVFARQWARLAPIAERAARISAAEGFRFWEPSARICLALVEAQDGDRQGAIQRIIENMKQFRATDSSIVMSQFEPALSELLIESGDPAHAARRLSDAIEIQNAVASATICQNYTVFALSLSANSTISNGPRRTRERRAASPESKALCL